MRMYRLSSGNILDGENAILHASFNLIDLSILRQPEPSKELPGASLHSVPLIILIFLLFAPLAADLKDFAFFYLNFYLFLFQSGKVGFENVRFRRLFPVDSGIGER